MAETPWITDTIARTSAAPLQATDFMRVGRSTTSMKATMADIATYVASGMAAMAVIATTIELGHASDTTLSRVAAGRVAIEGHEIATLDQTQTFTGVKTLTTPILGVATATSINKVAITEPASSATLTIANGKTLTVSNTITFTATDGSTLAIGTGGTLGTAAYATIGTSGDTVPKNNTANTWSATQRFNNGSYVLLGTSGSAHMYVGHDGTNIIHQRYNSAGVLQDTPITINLSSGLITVGTLTGTLSSPTLSGTVAGSPTFSGGPTFASNSPIFTISQDIRNDLRHTDGGTNRWANGRAAGGGGAADDFQIYNYGTATVALRIPYTTNIANFPVGLQSGGNTVLTTATGAQLGVANTFMNNILWGNGVGTLTFAGSDAYIDSTGVLYLRPSGGSGVRVVSNDPRLYLYDSNGATNGKGWLVYGGGASAGVDSPFVLYTTDDSYGAGTVAFQVTRSGTTPSTFDVLRGGGTFTFGNNGGGAEVTMGGGVLIGAATGGLKGVGTINATAVYDDNTLLTCYVFDAANDNGVVDTAKWDAKAPGGRHAPLRKFVARLGTEYDPLDIDAYAKHWKDKRHLTSMPNEARFKHGDMATGEWIQRLIETVEIQAVHIDTLNQRLKLLEAA